MLQTTHVPVQTENHTFCAQIIISNQKYTIIFLKVNI